MISRSAPIPARSVPSCRDPADAGSSPTAALLAIPSSSDTVVSARQYTRMGKAPALMGPNLGSHWTSAEMISQLLATDAARISQNRGPSLQQGEKVRNWPPRFPLLSLAPLPPSYFASRRTQTCGSIQWEAHRVTEDHELRRHVTLGCARRHSRLRGRADRPGAMQVIAHVPAILALTSQHRAPSFRPSPANRRRGRYGRALHSLPLPDELRRRRLSPPSIPRSAEAA
jgi:hypothetical protein